MQATPIHAWGLAPCTLLRCYCMFVYTSTMPILVCSLYPVRSTSNISHIGTLCTWLPAMTLCIYSQYSWHHPKVFQSIQGRDSAYLKMKRKKSASAFYVSWNCPDFLKCSVCAPASKKNCMPQEIDGLARYREGQELFGSSSSQQFFGPIVRLRPRLCHGST